MVFSSYVVFEMVAPSEHFRTLWTLEGFPFPTVLKLMHSQSMLIFIYLVAWKAKNCIVSVT